ncbi:putative WRKY transcription factor 17 [Capsicum baccatum]|uniref:WRKY transcription factor 17 n=1 Tax=Capsicum baccatum TaxID=33114 RepID=A0A2G2UY22_CAPBA|nr:putative WRKY transcription factor 17 [Capsicum baccatum]
MNKELALQEAASTGLQTMEHLIKLAANESVVQVDCREITDFAVVKLKKANAMVGRTGHARFRCCPVQVQAQNKAESQAQAQDQVHDSLTLLSLSPYGYKEKERVLASMTLSVVASVAAPVQTELTLGFKMPSVNDDVGGAGVGNMKWKDDFGSMKNWINSSSFLSFITGEGSESIVNVVPPPSSSMLLLPMAQVVSAEKQSSATGKRCREQEQSGDGSGKKRVYYKCTSFPGCPAKKHVERAMEDPMMLIVTYEEEHHHTQVTIQEYNSQMMAFGLAGEKK